MNERWHDTIVPNKFCKGVMESRIGGRPENQDYFGCSDTPIGLLIVVCDGMGGGPGGALASSVATKDIINDVKKAQADASEKKEILEEAIKDANSNLRRLQSQDKNLVGMGTTCVALLFDQQQIIAAHVGDSRIYQMRFGTKIWRTFDHSKVMEQTLNSSTYTEEDARTDPDNNVITRALGISEEIHIDTKVLSCEKGDRFALCTDGVWGAMPEPLLIKLLNHSNNINGTVEKTMIAVQEYGLVNKKGLHDNFTLVLAEAMYNSNLKEEMTHKTRLTLRILSFLLGFSLLLNIIFIHSKPQNINDNPSLSIAGDSVDSDTYKEEELNNLMLKDSIESLWDTIFSLRKRNRNLFEQIKDDN